MDAEARLTRVHKRLQRISDSQVSYKSKGLASAISVFHALPTDDFQLLSSSIQTTMLPNMHGKLPTSDISYDPKKTVQEPEKALQSNDDTASTSSDNFDSFPLIACYTIFTTIILVRLTCLVSVSKNPLFRPQFTAPVRNVQYVFKDFTFSASWTNDGAHVLDIDTLLGIILGVFFGIAAGVDFASAGIVCWWHRRQVKRRLSESSDAQV